MAVFAQKGEKQLLASSEARLHDADGSWLGDGGRDVLYRFCERRDGCSGSVGG